MITSKVKKVVVSAISVMALVLILFCQPALADSDRIFGSGRVETALEICNAGWSTAGTVIIAPADQSNLVDALAASSLAGQEESPILLTPKNSLDPKVKSRILTLGVSKVYVVGAITDKVIEELQTIPNVEIELLKGDNRWQTAKEINDKLQNPAGTFVVGYNATPDALSVASYAARNRYAVILADTEGRIPFGQNLLGSNVYIIGGPNLVKDIPGAMRIFGRDRFETNKKVAETLSYTYTKVYLANGSDSHLVDALTAAPLACKDEAFIALTDGSNLSSASLLNNKMNRISKVIAIGGTSVVTDAVKERLYYTQSNFALQSIKALDSTMLEIRFNKAVDKNSILISPGYDKLKYGVIEIKRNPEHDGKKDVDADYIPAVLSPDGTTLTLRVSQGTYMDGNYGVIINPGIITSVDGDELGRYATPISVNDKTPPNIHAVRFNPATDRIEIVMSEVCEILPNVSANNGDQTLAEDSTRTVLSFPNQWDSGDQILINIDMAKDYVGNEQTEPYTISIRIPQDDNELKISAVSQTDSNEFQIIFNKAIEPNDDDNQRARNVEEGIYISRDGIPVTIANIETDISDPEKRTYKVRLDSEGMPDYEFYGSKSRVELDIYFEEGELRDVFGNTNLSIAEKLIMTKDERGPVINSARVTWKGDTFVLRFDEDVQYDQLDRFHITQGGTDVTDQFSVLPYENYITNPREVIMIYRGGGTAIGAGSYNIGIESNVISDTHWNYNASQSVDIIVR